MSSPGRSPNRSDPTITMEDFSQERKPNIQAPAATNVPLLNSTVNVNPKNSSSSPPPLLDDPKLTSSNHLSPPPFTKTSIRKSIIAPSPRRRTCATGIHDEDDHYFNNFPPGYRFVPHDHELVVNYLTRKVKGQSLPRNRIVDVKLYQYNPEDLAAKYKNYGEKDWYFFTPRDRKYKNGSRPNRAAGNGYWKATGADKNITTKKDGAIVGLRKALVFYTGKAPKGEKTNWIMHEFRVPDKPNSQIRNNRDDMRLDDWVLCRIYKKTDKPGAKNPQSGKENHPAAKNHQDDPDELPMDDCAGEYYNTDDALGDQLTFVFDHHDLCPPQQQNAYTGFSDPNFCTGFSAPTHEMLQDLQAPSLSETYDIPLPVPPHSNNWIKLPPRGGFPDEIWNPEIFSHHQVPNFHDPSFFGARYPSFQSNNNFHIPLNGQQPLPATMRSPMPMNCPSNPPPPPIPPIRQWPMNFPSNHLPSTTTNNQPITRLPAPITRPGNIHPPSNLPAPTNPASNSPSTSAVDVVAKLPKQQSPHADDYC